MRLDDVMFQPDSPSQDPTLDVGLLIAGGLTARYTRKPVWWAATRQLMFGAVAVAATYLLGLLVAAVI